MYVQNFLQFDMAAIPFVEKTFSRIRRWDRNEYSRNLQQCSLTVKGCVGLVSSTACRTAWASVWALTVCQNMGKCAVSLFVSFSFFSADDDAPSDGKG
jgi:hypothetical protein